MMPMSMRTRVATTLVLLAALGALSTAPTSDARVTQPDAVRALDGEWLYVEDRTEGRAVEEQQPPMSMKFALRVEDDAVVMVRGEGERRRERRLALDGSTTESARETSIARYRSIWKDGALEYETDLVRVSDGSRIALYVSELRPTADGLLVRVADGVALYRHPEDIAMPESVPATIDDVAWLSGAWVGTRGKSSIEERWSPPGGGAMLGVSRTISRAKGKMVGFEFLRIIERDGGLVYVAQPGGRSSTEFVLTELGSEAGGHRAAFENPRHDFPQRIVYELSADGDLSAAIGFVNGGRPRRFEFEREGP